MKFTRAAIFLCVFAGATLLQAHAQDQAKGGRGWLASGIIVGARGQYRVPEPTYSVGYDGDWFTVISTGDRIDLPMLGPMVGYGAYIGFTSSENLRDPAYVLNAAWSMTKGQGDSTIGVLAYVDHEIGLDLEMLFPMRKGFALCGQLGWDFEFFSVTDGFLPFDKSRVDLLLSSFFGLDCGIGLAYVAERRLVIEAKAVVRMSSDNLASGAGNSDSLGGEIGRGEYSFELSTGWIL